jgi:predicted PurR-regulated permease PerM
MTPERWVRFPVRTVLVVIALVIAVWALIAILSIAREVITWILIAIFLALAMNQGVDLLMRRGVKRRGMAVAITYLGVLGAIAAVGATFVPILIDQVNEFVDKVPEYVEDLTKGEGKLGFLQEQYQIVDKIKAAIREGGAERIFGLSGTAISITKSVLTIIAAVVTIAFLTLFMLLEGPAWLERFYSLMPERSQPRWRRLGNEMYRTVGGYVTGNLFISVIAGISYTIVMLIMGVPFAIALGLVVAILDLVPMVGATLATVIVGTVAFFDSIAAGIVIVVFAIIYQQIENHLLQPLVYGRTVKLSPLAVLIAVLVGASLAGVLGALAAIPIAGAIQVLILDWRRSREAVAAEEVPATVDERAG